MALQEAGGRGISNTNMPILKARCHISCSSSRTPARKAALDKVVLANIVMLVSAFLRFTDHS
ncbi:hypothetical protein DPMN_035427 [Dreissena polymorpha]|uniref:Uncharacterized protein n=1 Tax=Dreissena polymorpha TaxID=45954 RepID=A0A9D4M798_DREPO|nr:hypothetical protein DPMN_035427 [Dreissena polymorpha]